jgi:predicted metalloendopeptidase
VAGYAPDEAARLGTLASGIEAALQKGKLTPVEANDPAMINNPVSLAQMQALIPEVNLQLYLDAIGIPQPGELVLTEPRYFPVLSQVLRDYSLQDIKDYLTVLTITGYSGILSTGFDEPTRAWAAVLTGVPVLPPPDERALALIQGALGHPLSRIYVDNFFSDETKAGAEQMIAQIVAAFRARIPSRDWLTEGGCAVGARRLPRYLDRLFRRRYRPGPGGKHQRHRFLPAPPCRGKIQSDRIAGRICHERHLRLCPERGL